MKPCETFDFQNPLMNPFELIQELHDKVWEYKGIGLAANQIGYPWRVFIMPAAPQDIVVFNPRIVMPSTETVELEEGCLSWPGIVVKIKRPQHIRVRYADVNGNIQTQQFTGMTARIFQHETEHCDGGLFFSNVSRLKLSLALKSAAKRGHNYTSMNLLRFAK